jgi:hypothetical protein
MTIACPDIMTACPTIMMACPGSGTARGLVHRGERASYRMAADHVKKKKNGSLGRGDYETDRLDCTAKDIYPIAQIDNNRPRSKKPS